MQVVIYKLEWSTKAILIVIAICLMGILLKPSPFTQRQAEAIRGYPVSAEEAYELAERAYSYANDAYAEAQNALTRADEAYSLAEDAYYKE